MKAMRFYLWIAALFFVIASIAVADQNPTVYVTRTGKKYHSAGCSSLSKSSIPISLKDAVAKGYGPCSKCKPPILSAGSTSDKTVSPDTARKTEALNPSQGSSSGETYKGHQVQTGPRGGKYYINKNGNKTYIRKKK